MDNGGVDADDVPAVRTFLSFLTASLLTTTADRMPPWALLAPRPDPRAFSTTRRSTSRRPIGTSEQFRSPSSPYLTAFPPAHAGPASRSTPHLSSPTRLSFSPSSLRYTGQSHHRPLSPTNGTSIASRWRSKSRGRGKRERSRDTAPRLAPLVFAPVDLSGVVLAAYADDRGLGRGRTTRALRRGGEAETAGRGRGRGGCDGEQVSFHHATVQDAPPPPPLLASSCFPPARTNSEAAIVPPNAASTSHGVDSGTPCEAGSSEQGAYALHEPAPLSTQLPVAIARPIASDRQGQPGPLRTSGAPSKQAALVVRSLPLPSSSSALPTRLEGRWSDNQAQARILAGSSSPPEANASGAPSSCQLAPPIPRIVVSRPSPPDEMALDMLRRTSLRVRGQADEGCAPAGSSSLLRRITLGARGLTRGGDRVRTARRPRTAPERGLDEWGVGSDGRAADGAEAGPGGAWEVVDPRDADGWVAPDVQDGRGPARRFTRRFGRTRHVDKDKEASSSPMHPAGTRGRGAAKDTGADDAQMTSIGVDDDCAASDAPHASARAREPLDMDHYDHFRDPCASHFRASDHHRQESKTEQGQPKSKSVIATDGQAESGLGRDERGGNAAENENSCQLSGCQHCDFLPPNTMTALLTTRPSFSPASKPSSNQHSNSLPHPQSYLSLDQPHRRPPRNERRSNERSRSPPPLPAGSSRLTAISTSTSTATSSTSPLQPRSHSHPSNTTHISTSSPDSRTNAKPCSPSRSHSRSHSHPANTTHISTSYSSHPHSDISHSRSSDRHPGLEAHISTSNTTTSHSRPSDAPAASPTQTRSHSRSHIRSRSRSGSPRPPPQVLDDAMPPVPPLPPLSSSVPPFPPPEPNGAAYTTSEVGHAYTASDAGHGAYTTSDAGHGHVYAMSDVGHGTMSDIGHAPASAGGGGRRQVPPSAFNLRAFGMTPIRNAKDKSQGDKEKEKGGSFVRRASMKHVKAVLRRLSGSGSPRDEDRDEMASPLAPYTSSPTSYHPDSPLPASAPVDLHARNETFDQAKGKQGKLVKPRRAVTADTPRLSVSSCVSEPSHPSSDPTRNSLDRAAGLVEHRALVRVPLRMRNDEYSNSIPNPNSQVQGQGQGAPAPVRKRTASHGKLTKPRPAKVEVSIPTTEISLVSPRRAKFTLGAPADESDVERFAPTIESAPPRQSQATPRPPLHRSIAQLDPSSPDAPGRRRWTLAAAMADEGVSDAGLVRELERMREIGVWARERERARAAAAGDVENSHTSIHPYGYDEDAEMGLGVWLDREGMMERERERERGMCDSPAPGPGPPAVEEREELDRRASAPPAVPTHGQVQAQTTAPGRASAPPPTPLDPQAEWHIAQRALLICRELLLTEKRYQRLVSALHAGHTAPPPPALMRALAGELSLVSTQVLAGMTAAPGAAGVARALLANAEELERVYVRWCGAVGAWFGPAQQEGGEGGVVKKKRSKGAGGLLAGSGSMSAGGEEGTGEKESPLKRASAGWRRSMTSVPSLVRDASGVSLVYAGSSTSAGHAEDASSGEQGPPVPKAERLPLVRDLAILPTQRVMRYVLLYRDLLAHTPPTSPARHIVERACMAVTRIAARCDRAQDHAAFVSSSSALASSSQQQQQQAPPHQHHHPNSISYSHSTSTTHSHSHSHPQSHRTGAQGATRAGSGASTSSRGSAINRAASPAATTSSSASYSTAPTSVALSRVGSGGPRDGMSPHAATASTYAYASGSSSGCGSGSPSSTPATTPGSGPYSEDGSASDPAHGSASHPSLPPLPPMPLSQPVLQGKPMLRTKRSGLGNGVRRLSMSSVSLSLMSSMGMRSRSTAALPVD